MQKITRNFYVCFLLTAIVIVGGGTLFRDSEIGSLATVLIAIGGGIVLLNLLDDREKRRREESRS
jgi:hypothetical protein